MWYQVVLSNPWPRYNIAPLLAQISLTGSQVVDPLRFRNIAAILSRYFVEIV